ncbi:MAG: DUF4430 domain-containing protein [Candidatus Diapherotrites archaeon]|nr:DUF4430 domain-containing protein [Candidatus Diapherotrites archaeon]
MRKIGFLFFVLLFVFAQAAQAKTVNVKFNFPYANASADTSASVNVADDANAFTAFVQAAQEKSVALDIAYYDFDGDGVKESAFVNSVNGLGASSDFSKYWQFGENNLPSMTGISAAVPNDNGTVSLDYLDGAGADAVEWLADSQETGGRIGANLFQHSFGMMGLGMGRDNNIALASAVPGNAKSYIIAQQQSDASFGDSLNTALAAMALISAGEDLNSFEKNGRTTIDLLKDSQQGDGGFKSGSGESDVDTTAWAVVAFAQAGESMPENGGETPADYLVSAMHSNGSFGYNSGDETESVDFTEEAIIALGAAGEGKSVAQKSIDWLAAKQDSDGCISDGFRTALGSIAFRAFNETEKADKALDCLKTKANADGSFGRQSNSSNAIDTALAAIALDKKTFPLSVQAPSGGRNEGTVGLNSTVKFIVSIKNVGRVDAKNVSVSLDGIPASWIISGTSTTFFDSIKKGETKNAEIFAKIQGLGSYSVKAVISSDTITDSIETADSAQLLSEEASLEATVGFE